MKISFDFDGTLSIVGVQRLAKIFIRQGHEIWITSCRMSEMQGRPEWNNELYRIALELDIPTSRIQLTNGSDKWYYLNGFDIHVDDDQLEIELLNEKLPELKCIHIYSQEKAFGLQATSVFINEDSEIDMDVLMKHVKLQ